MAVLLQWLRRKVFACSGPATSSDWRMTTGFARILSELSIAVSRNSSWAISFRSSCSRADRTMLVYPIREGAMAKSEESEGEAAPVRHHVHNASNLHQEETGWVLQLSLPRAASIQLQRASCGLDYMVCYLVFRKFIGQISRYPEAMFLRNWVRFSDLKCLHNIRFFSIFSVSAIMPTYSVESSFSSGVRARASLFGPGQK